MSDISTETSHKNVRPSAQAEATNTESATELERLRRSERVRTLTEKGREFQGERLKHIQRRNKIIYEKWRCHARIGKELLSDDASEDELNELIENIKYTCSAVRVVYEELRQIQTPEPDLRRRVDTCISFSGFLIKRAERQLKGHKSDEDEEPWPDVGSVLDSTGSVSRPLSHRSRCSSTHTSIHSVKRIEAVAEAAATQEVLAVLEEQEREETELQMLEAENLAKQQAIQDKCRKLARLEEVKKLNAARARVRIYDEVEENIEATDLLYGFEVAPELQVTSFTIPPVTTHALNASSPPFISQFLAATSQSPCPQQLPQSPAASVLRPQEQNSSDLVTALVEAISANRLPTPEPAVFTGDPLKFKDWQLSFETLIERKNIPKNEKLHYLRKYLGGTAKKAVEGYLLFGTETAYDSAWKLLGKRFGDPFLIGKSLRERLHAWPMISSKDACELREFADFLKSCEAAMSHIKTLEVLNDCIESQRLLLKLPDWLVSSWNRKVMEVRQVKAEYPPFKVFVDFLSKEADLACVPISSIQAHKECGR